MMGGAFMQYRKDKYGNELSVLGYGCMRFTRKGPAIDVDKAEKEILEATMPGLIIMTPRISTREARQP